MGSQGLPTEKGKENWKIGLGPQGLGGLEGLQPKGQVRPKQEGEDQDQSLLRAEKERERTASAEEPLSLSLPFTPSHSRDRGQTIRPYSLRELLLGSGVVLRLHRRCVALTCPPVCFFAGKRGFGRDHVLPLLPAHSRQAHPHRDQMSEPQGNGHHRLLRYLSYPGACHVASPQSRL